MSEKKRTFISIDLPDGVKDAVRDLKNPDLRWVKWMTPDNMHITLNFLGELSEEEIKQAKAAIADTVPFHQPFSLELNRFKKVRNMLWLMPGNCPSLFDLREELTEKLKKQKIHKRERHKYNPHILIAKTWKRHRKMTWQPEEFSGVSFEVDTVNLYESELTPGSATHILIEAFLLGEVYEN